jgi:manganese transport protein
VLLTTGILGATVMPHVIYLHSALVQDRAGHADESRLRRLLHAQRVDVIVALGLAGAIMVDSWGRGSAWEVWGRAR